jgi:hypothetical protein
MLATALHWPGLATFSVCDTPSIGFQMLLMTWVLLPLLALIGAYSYGPQLPSSAVLMHVACAPDWPAGADDAALPDALADDAAGEDELGCELLDELLLLHAPSKPAIATIGIAVHIVLRPDIATPHDSVFPSGTHSIGVLRQTGHPRTVISKKISFLWPLRQCLAGPG